MWEVVCLGARLKARLLFFRDAPEPNEFPFSFFSSFVLLVRVVGRIIYAVVLGGQVPLVSFAIWIPLTRTKRAICRVALFVLCRPCFRKEAAKRKALVIGSKECRLTSDAGETEYSK